MKLLLLFNEFFLYLNAFHRNLNFLEQTCTFLHLLKQLSSLSYVCFIRHGIFILPQPFFSPWLFYFAVSFFVLPWLFCFAVAFFVLPQLFRFAVAPLICHGFFSFAVAFGCRGMIYIWFFVKMLHLGLATTSRCHKINIFSSLWSIFWKRIVTNVYLINNNK